MKERTLEKPSFESYISQLVNSRMEHAKFVNTLSLLEYIGARKIIKSQAESSISLEILSHAAEEIRHAFALKKVALKMSEGMLQTYAEAHLLCAREAHRYIQNIDQGVAKVLAQGTVELERGSSPSQIETNYLLTTLLLEERANQLYPVYESYLAACGFPGVLKAICREEDSHLKAVTEGLAGNQNLSSTQLAQLRQLEENEFSIFLQSLVKSLN